MRWIYGYLLLWAVAIFLIIRDFLPLAPYLIFETPRVDVWIVYLSFIVCLALLGSVLPGKTYVGTPLVDGSSLKYKCNGLALTAVFVSALVVASWTGMVDAAWVADHYSQLFVVANAFALALSVYLFAKGRMVRPKNWLKVRSIYEDFVMGAQLNPFVLGVNVKFFSYRPAMAGWLIVNLSFLYKQHDILGFVTMRMLFYQLATGIYIVDYFVNEPKMLSTWDIMAEHFGLMLIWGDYVFIVFAFSIQNFFLLDDTRPMSLLHILFFVLVFSTGFAIFRGANSQKHRFKTNPNALIFGKLPVTIGGKLLASGYWGLSRHMNYTGDLLLALSFCLPCGIDSSLPYFYFTYLLLLTVHREKRDEERCSLKYKSLWEDYCRYVPYRMVPFVY